jgi:DNA (cytosine-5)-methyltransferase 1
MNEWPVFEGDVREFNYDDVPEDIDLIAAGVPCQPFSIGGKHQGPQDERNMFPELVRAIRRVKPKAVLVENVKGLSRASFGKYFGYVHLMLTYPEISRKLGEPWSDHLARLERYHTHGKRDGLYYRVVHRVLNAADYGVPQKRERVFIVAIRADLGVEWAFPSPTHSADSLLWQQYGSFEYWERHGIRKSGIVAASPSVKSRVAQVSDAFSTLLEPWRTVRDAIADLPVPKPNRRAQEPELTHFLVPGARSYEGHTGSPLDEPAKTLKAGVHGVPGGENMLALPNGCVRYFSIRESARLQAFPDRFVFPGSWTESMRQIGNAVPVRLAEVVARAVAQTLVAGASREQSWVNHNRNSNN